jgi:hypothetical protein
VQSQKEALDNALATKTDLGVVRQEIAEVKTDIIKWVTGMLAAQTAVVATLVKLL